MNGEQQDQQEKKAAKRPIGSIGQFATLGGGGKRAEVADAQTSERPDVQEARQPDVKAPRPKRERHTIYLPAELSEWTKIHAIKARRDMSDIVAEALEQYRDRL